MPRSPRSRSVTPSASSITRAALRTIGSTSMTSGMTPLSVTRYTLTSALGHGVAAQLAALRGGRTGLQQKRFETCDLPCFIGEVSSLDSPLTGARAQWDCRNNRLAWLALQQDAFLDAAI